jgi:hypothetical protein
MENLNYKFIFMLKAKKIDCEETTLEEEKKLEGDKHYWFSKRR